MTDNNKLESGLADYRERLEEIVEERTTQLRSTVEQLKVEIEARKEAEDSLREAEADLNRAQAVAHTGSWRMNVRANELRWSDETYRMFGIPKGIALNYEVFLSCIHPDDREAVDKAWRSALTGEPYDIEHRIVVGDTVMWVHETAELEFDSEGELLGGFGTAQDITYHKHAEEALRESEAAFRLLGDAIPQLTWMADPDGYIFWYNQRWYDYTGTSPEEMKGWGWQSVHDPDLLPTVLEQWKAAIAEGVPFEAEFPLRAASGEFRWFLTRSIPANDENGRVVRWFGTNTDVSDRREMELRKDELFEREHRIAETLQAALIPSQVPQRVGDWCVAARYRPALREAQVGGDFYDVFKVTEDRLGILIGDITGKGLDAAIQVASVRHAIRSYAYVEASPAMVMTLTNEALCREGSEEQNALTAVFGIVDLAADTITYANAGHEPPLVRTGLDKIRELQVTGPMVGIIQGFTYQERTIHLEPGAELIMFTDGITEARTGGVLLEQQGVIRALQYAGNATPDEIAEALLGAAIAHTGGDLQDDAAILVLTYDADSSEC